MHPDHSFIDSLIHTADTVARPLRVSTGTGLWGYRDKRVRVLALPVGTTDNKQATNKIALC